MANFIPVPLSIKVHNRLKHLNSGDPHDTMDQKIGKALDTLEDLTKAQAESLQYLKDLRVKLGEAAKQVKEIKRYKTFVEWLDQHPELDKTEIIGLWLNREYSDIQEKYVTYTFPKGFFPESANDNT